MNAIFKKFNELPSATLPLTGTEQVPIMQNGVTSVTTTAALKSVPFSTPQLFIDGTVGVPSIAFINEPTTGFYRAGALQLNVAIGGTEMWRFAVGSLIGIRPNGSAVNLRLSQTGITDFTLNNEATTGNIVFAGANNYEFRNGASAQFLRIYGTFTNSSNYERLSIGNSGGFMNIATEQAGSGSARSIIFSTNGQTRWSIDTAGHLFAANDTLYDIGSTGFTKPRTLYMGTSIVNANGSAGTPSYQFAAATNTGFFSLSANFLAVSIAGAARVGFGDSNFGIQVRGDHKIGWSSSVVDGVTATDVILIREAADTLALQRTTNPQAFRLYNTFTDASNYERGFVRWNTNIFEVGSENAGTGSARGVRILSAGGLNLTSSNADRWQVQSATGHFLALTDNTFDIGASGATRPRSIYAGTNVVTPQVLSIGTGNIQLATGGGVQAVIEQNASIANFAVLGGGATGVAAYLRVDGETNVSLDIRPKGSGNIQLTPSTGDIKWGKALVALGGGATATLGTIAGSGPAAAAQNTWMRVLDSTGAAFWVPAWK